MSHRLRSGSIGTVALESLEHKRREAVVKSIEWSLNRIRDNDNPLSPESSVIYARIDLTSETGYEVEMSPDLEDITP